MLFVRREFKWYKKNAIKLIIFRDKTRRIRGMGRSIIIPIWWSHMNRIVTATATKRTIISSSFSLSTQDKTYHFPFNLNLIFIFLLSHRRSHARRPVIISAVSVARLETSRSRGSHGRVMSSYKSTDSLALWWWGWSLNNNKQSNLISKSYMIIAHSSRFPRLSVNATVPRRSSQFLSARSAMATWQFVDKLSVIVLSYPTGVYETSIRGY